YASEALELLSRALKEDLTNPNIHKLMGDAYRAAGQRALAKEKYEDYCKHCSEMEVVASNAERASIKYKQVEYLGERLGEIYEGVISGVTEWGLYVELDENKCEGLVPVRDLEDDYYEFDEKNYCLIGRRKKGRYQLGDKVTIQIARADLVKKQLDFALIDKNHPAGTHKIDAKPRTQSQSKRVQQQQRNERSSSPSKGGHERGGKKQPKRH
ncbi:MAG: S1 RNA-binding domain-containing protein, partial [Muribaculaceae bacterium]